MPTSKKHLEPFNLHYQTSNGQVYTKSGFHISTRSSLVMQAQLQVSNELDLCFSDFSEISHKKVQPYSILFTLSSNKTTDSTLTP